MSQKNKNEYDLIPLAVAAKEVNFTPEYLNSLSRSGKLKAEKIGRNWLTTRRWLKEFIMGRNEDDVLEDTAADDVEAGKTKKPYCDVLAVKIARMEKELEELRKEKEQREKKEESSIKKHPVMYMFAISGLFIIGIFASHLLCSHMPLTNPENLSVKSEKTTGMQEIEQKSLFLAETVH